VSALDRADANRRILLILVLVGASLFFGSILFILSRAH
jgi:hypothetical protein